jgi:hypothetical protein
MSAEELEVYGLDWEALQDGTVLQSRDANNHGENSDSSWLGHRGPPENLSQVDVDPPPGIFTGDELQMLDHVLYLLVGTGGDHEVEFLWTQALVFARNLHPNLF